MCFVEQTLAKPKLVVGSVNNMSMSDKAEAMVQMSLRILHGSLFSVQHDTGNG